MAAYAQISDLMLGNVPMPGYVDAAAMIQGAADEIDAVIGLTYVTPVSITDTPATRASRLMLKKANAMLASGRIIMAVDAGGQDTDLHKYGRYLIGEAEKIVAAIASGQITLQGATPLSASPGGTAPVIVNLDAESSVESFYDNFKPVDTCLPRRYWWQ